MTAITVTWLIIEPTLPDVEELRDVRLQVPLRIYAADERLISEMGEQRRIPMRFEDIPEPLIQAFLTAEDDRFYRHPGIDWRGTLRGAWLYARSLGKGRVPGGSTITQQVARRFFLTTEYSVTRKVREMMLALKIERELSKDEILALYLNKEFLGHRAYGVGAAAQVYYGKTPDELTLAEAATLAALPKAPSRVNPITSPAQTRIRRDYVLERMHRLGLIDAAELRAALAEPVETFYHGLTTEVSAPWVAEMARMEAIELLGEEEAYGGGYRVYTTLQPELQEAAIRALRAGLLSYDRRHGWRGPEGRLEPEILEDPQALDRARRNLRTRVGLPAGIVLEANAERARVLLAGDEQIELDREAVAWRSFETRNATGPAPAGPADILAPGDLIRVRPTEDGWRLAQLPEAEGALVALDPQSGALLALVGGSDYSRSQFNRAVQARRQPGSAFKPFIYAAALDRGFTPASIIVDAPVVVDDPSLEGAWRPSNFEGRFFGPTRLREAMIHSRNLVSVRLLMNLGLDYARDYISGFGFDREHLPPGMSMALGSASLSPLEVTTGFAVFANGGFAVEPQFIDRIVDADGRIVYQPQWSTICPDCPPPRDPERQQALQAMRVALELEDAQDDTPAYRPLSLDAHDSAPPVDDAESKTLGPPEPRLAPQVISPQTAYLIRSMLMDVIRSGTGRRALELGRSDLAGKTGTTNDFRDVWFVGFNNHITAGVWIGLDDHDSLGSQEQGGRTALPVWVEFMQTALEGIPESSIVMPPGLASARINPTTGLRVRPGTPDAIQEWFHADNLPPIEGDRATRDNGRREVEDPYEIF